MRSGEIALYRALQDLPDAQVRWPSLALQKRWSGFITEKEPLVKHKFGFIDGKNYRVQRPGKDDLQNAYYNGWLHCVLVTGTLCFGVDGTIIWGNINNPGSWNDAETSREFVEKLLSTEFCPDQTMGVVSDSAFPVSEALYTRIETPLKMGDLEKLPIEQQFIAMAKSNAICSIRQAAEWGMGAVEKVFRRLLEKLPFHPVLRELRLRNLHQLYNFRVRTTGISQIRNVFQ
jgi:hypothetical protein